VVDKPDKQEGDWLIKGTRPEDIRYITFADSHSFKEKMEIQSRMGEGRW
jgi:hypothetical protein